MLAVVVLGRRRVVVVVVMLGLRCKANGGERPNQQQRSTHEGR